MPRVIATDVLSGPRHIKRLTLFGVHVRVEIRPMRDMKIDKAQSLASDRFSRDMVP